MGLLIAAGTCIKLMEYSVNGPTAIEASCLQRINPMEIASQDTELRCVRAALEDAEADSSTAELKVETNRPSVSRKSSAGEYTRVPVAGGAVPLDV